MSSGEILQQQYPVFHLPHIQQSQLLQQPPLFSFQSQSPSNLFSTGTSTQRVAKKRARKAKKRAASTSSSYVPNDVRMEESGWQSLSSLQTETMMRMVCDRLCMIYPQTIQAVRCTCKAWKQATESYGRIHVIRIDNRKTFSLGRPTEVVVQPKSNQEPFEAQDQKEDSASQVADKKAARDFANAISQPQDEHNTLISLVYLQTSDFINLKQETIEFKRPTKVISQHACRMTPFYDDSDNEQTGSGTSSSMILRGRNRYVQVRMPNQLTIEQHPVEFHNVRLSFSNIITFSTPGEADNFLFTASQSGQILLTDAQLAAKNSALRAKDGGYVKLLRTQLVSAGVLSALGGGRIELVSCTGDMYMIDVHEHSNVSMTDCKLELLEMPQRSNHLVYVQGGKVNLQNCTISITAEMCGDEYFDVKPYDSSVVHDWIIFNCSDNGQLRLQNVTIKLLDILSDPLVSDLVIKDISFQDQQVKLHELIQQFGSAKYE
eukprot:TRINITY_DN584_c0_g1_i6.p1 TRINITY_DN584_c0_g1~~TRINITY_DN584_c0_g1_i6.p1  ORF type:complete len:490 (-),score=41.30 TRINITY_DN584_c0_g1_i6:972-2441(-)